MRIAAATALLALSATASAAQLGDIFRSFLGGTQQPFVASVEEAQTHTLTDKNWLETINTTTVPSLLTGNPNEWLLYFTASGNISTARNLTMWDEIYTDVLVKLTALKSHVQFAKVDYSSPETTTLTKAFFLSETGLPAIYHVAQFPHNGSILLRPYEGSINKTIPEKKEHLVEFFTEKHWTEVKPWTGMFNPINGTLKEAGPYVGEFLRYYEKCPQWLMMILLSLGSRKLTSHLGIGRQNRPRDPPPTAT